MSLFYYIELLNNHGDVQTRHKFNELPIRLGRGYNNEMIIDDPYIAAEQAIIEHDNSGGIKLRNLGSHHNIKIKGKACSDIKLTGDTIAQLGHTHIRVRDSHYVVNTEIMDATHRRWQGWPLIIFCALIICALALSEFWLDDIDNKKLTDYISNMLQWILFAAAWAGIWALANRVFGKTTNFSSHLWVLCSGMLALDITHYISTLLAFSLAWNTPTLFKGHFIIVIVAAMIYYHLKLINTHKQNLFKALCIGSAIIVVALKLTTNYQSSNRYADEPYVNEMLPPALRISHNHNIAEFSNAINKLKKNINTERENSLKDKDRKTPKI